MPRRASKHITLVLIGSASLLAGCSPSPQDQLVRDHYGSVEDCAADWGRPESCEPAYRNGSSGSSGGGGYIFRGPAYYGAYRSDAQAEARQQAGKAGLAPSDRSISRVTAPSGTARSGFGSSARSYSSSGS
jgi:uncharacterized protein YgiB involved in biofilm formation